MFSDLPQPPTPPTHHPTENFAVYLEMWENMVGPNRPHTTIYGLNAEYLRLQTHTQNMQYFIYFPPKEWLHERTSVLHYSTPRPV